jgi:hypothetical protein
VLKALARGSMSRAQRDVKARCAGCPTLEQEVRRSQPVGVGFENLFSERCGNASGSQKRKSREKFVE